MMTMDKMKPCRSLIFQSIVSESMRDKTDLNQSDMEKALKAECGSDGRWKFVTLLLNSILVLNDVVKRELERYTVLLQDMKNARPGDNSAPPMSPDTFSEAQKKALMTALQFVMCFGILPALQPGVGLPIEKRSGFSELLKVARLRLTVKEHSAELLTYVVFLFQTPGKVSKLPVETLEWRMVRCLRVLMQLLDQPSLATLILSRSASFLLLARSCALN